MGKGKSRSITGGYRGGRGAGASKPGKRPPLTHFLCLPLVTADSRPQFEEAFLKFKEIAKEIDGRTGDSAVGVGKLSIQENTSEDARKEPRGDAAASSSIEKNSPTFPEAAIRPVGTLHLTLGVMSLESSDSLQGAITLLQGLDIHNLASAPGTATERVAEHIKDTAAQTPPFCVSLTSLLSMHPPHRTTVLYTAPEDPTNQFLPFCERLRDVFIEKGFLVPDDRPLKLHATIVNTIYAKPGGRQATSRSVETSALGATDGPESNNRSHASGSTDSPGRERHFKRPHVFDAMLLLEECKDFVWAEDVIIEKLAICKMGAKKIVDANFSVVDEKYEEVASLRLPGRIVTDKP
jgi:activating signal cointegrator complex subunit 1